MIPARRAPLGAARQIANHNFAVAILGHEGISNEPPVTRNLRCLDRMPGVIILMRQRSLRRRRLLRQSVGKRAEQQRG